MKFSFTERTVSYPRFDVEAETLQKAYEIYRQRSMDGDQPDEQPVSASYLVAAAFDGKQLAADQVLELCEESGV